MKHKNNGTNHPANRDLIQAHSAPFIADLKAAGYAPNTLSVKKITLERFINWRSRRKSNSSSELDESDNPKAAGISMAIFAPPRWICASQNMTFRPAQPRSPAPTPSHQITLFAGVLES